MYTGLPGKRIQEPVLHEGDVFASFSFNQASTKILRNISRPNSDTSTTPQLQNCGCLVVNRGGATLQFSKCNILRKDLQPAFPNILNGKDSLKIRLFLNSSEDQRSKHFFDYRRVYNKIFQITVKSYRVFKNISEYRGRYSKPVTSIIERSRLLQDNVGGFSNILEHFKLAGTFIRWCNPKKNFILLQIKVCDSKFRLMCNFGSFFLSTDFQKQTIVMMRIQSPFDPNGNLQGVSLEIAALKECLTFSENPVNQNADKGEPKLAAARFYFRHSYNKKSIRVNKSDI
ncbi:hypothetical protein NQ315_002193 [Exocentrus adspersus]|uniref:Uncharacterized protein n=1 Tax=Exocentrus adspersus TaxID=1586481 RepID=A0AAV8W119_9CUCU|nr:hypothetical protein NQ315_002193 [Exocentrus adspersus]